MHSDIFSKKHHGSMLTPSSNKRILLSDFLLKFGMAIPCLTPGEKFRQTINTINQKGGFS